MKTKRSSGIIFLVVVLFVSSSFNSCKRAGKITIDPAFSAYISAFTSGSLSRESVIRIRLNSDVAKENNFNKVLPNPVFDFEPAIKGNSYWVDSRTLEFRPLEKMQAGKTYRASFALSKVMKVPAKFSEFNFEFQVIRQSFEVNVSGLKPLDNRNYNRQILSGNLLTADVEDGHAVEEVLTATQDNRKLPVRWTHATDRTNHFFEIDSIVRGDDSSFVILSWNGKPISVDITGQKTVTVPAFGDFVLMDTQVEQQETEQYLLLRFSDPLQENQNLQGLIKLGGMTDLRFSIEGNTIRVYPPSRQSSVLTLNVDASIKNILGKKLKENLAWNVQFEELKPAVRLAGKGIILPSGGGLLFPFESVNLSSVDVRIVKIFENNVAQFLQVNNLEGEQELSRVGRVVLKKSIPLSSVRPTELTRWNQYVLDLNDFIRLDPGSIYRVTIGFRKKYSLYHCTEEDSSIRQEPNMESMNDEWDENENKESSAWDYVEGYYNEDSEDGENPYQYQWKNRDNPCKKEYYGANHFVSRNILASDLGLIAKRGMEGSMQFTVTDLNTTQPLSGVTLEIYNLQHQLIRKVESDVTGLATVNFAEKPFLLVAKKGTQRGYLKLDDGSSLSLSMFDVAGERVQKGIKGFIYGERGVWRPGDSLFVMFMLEDKQHSLPQTFPVVFELNNPQGQLVKKIIRAESMNGFYTFCTATDPESPTGNWEAKVKVGNAVFRKNIRIETVMPNRLKIKFDFPKKYLAKDEKQSAKMEVLWLHGAVARNLKAEVEVSLTQTKTTFPKYTDYVFDDPTRKFNADKQVLFDKTVDENGKATVQADIAVEDASPGMLQANFVTKVFEPAGNFSIDRFSIPYYPYESYVGIRLPKGDKARGMLLTDTNHVVQLADVDKLGNPLPGKRKIEIEFYKVDWRWWWDKSEEDMTNFTSSRYQQFIQRDTIVAENGTGKWTLRLTYPNWGRYLIRARDIESGHSTGKLFYMDWPGWAGRAQRDQQGGATMLSFAADKEKYNVGEDVLLTIPTGKNSRALVSIESGSKVIKSYWVLGSEGQTSFKFPATADMAPNVYVNVTLLQPHSQTINDLPIRLFGVIPIAIENSATHIKPVIKMPEVLKPEEPVTIQVKEAQGHAMTYTLAVVDEGLLDLTRFATPDPWNVFYAREALGVKTWDMFDLVMGAHGAPMERVLSIGGDEGLNKPKEGSKANRFKPVVKFLGPFYLAKGATGSHTFTMPQYVGSVRTMVIAGDNGAYGFADKATPVRKPLMVLATLPRVLGPDEEVDLPVSVFAMEKNVRDVRVQIIPNEFLDVTGEKTKTVKFGRPGDELVTFKLKVKPKLGIARVKILATSGNEKAETSIELDIRVPNPVISEVNDTLLAGNQSWETTSTAIGMAGTNKLTLEFSSIPPLNLGTRLEYLIHYPYGCVEQTTSSVFPQLYLSDLMELSSSRKSEIEHNVKMGIERLRLFQLPNGGLSYWPGEHEDNEWATNYAGHFMIEAEAKGYGMPPGFIDQWKKYQRNKANAWTESSHESALTQAYRLFTLALAKSPELGSMNRLKESKSLPLTAKWSLAAAYQLAGQPELAREMTNSLPVQVGEYSELSNTWGSDERDEAIILETLSLTGQKERAFPVMKRISEALCSQTWMSTQTTAYSLSAMAKFIGKSGMNHPMDFEYQVNGGSLQKVTTQLPMKQSIIKINGTESSRISVKNSGSGVLYVRVIEQGIPKTSDQVNTQKNLEMVVAYKLIDGTVINPTTIKQGTDFYAEVKVTNPGIRGDYAELALAQLFPSGWEILNSRLDGADNSGKSDIPRYQDIRDDRVYTYFNLKAKESRTYRVYLNASYLGTFYLPTVSAEAMYDASIHAQTSGKWVIVSADKPTASK